MTMATNSWATLLELQWLQLSKLVGQHFLEWQWQQTYGQHVLHIMGANGYIKKTMPPCYHATNKYCHADYIFRGL